MSMLTDYYERLFFGNNQMPKRLTDTDIRHVTLNTCHSCNNPGGKVPSEAIEAYRPLLSGDLGVLSHAEATEMMKVGGNHPLPFSNGTLGFLATSDPTFGGNEISFTICLRREEPIPLVHGRYYDVDDGNSHLKWRQLMQTFGEVVEHNLAPTGFGFNLGILIDPPQAPWLGIFLTKPYFILQQQHPDLGCFLSFAEQTVAVTWNAIQKDRHDFRGNGASN